MTGDCPVGHALDIADQTETGAQVCALKGRLVERADITALAGRLDVAPDVLDAIVPALSSWRNRSRVRTAVDSLRHRETWQPLTATASSG